jgi:hypothetical protein
VLPVVCNKKAAFNVRKGSRSVVAVSPMGCPFLQILLRLTFHIAIPVICFQYSSGRSCSSPIPAAILILTSHLNIFNALRRKVSKPEDITCGSTIHTASTFPPRDNNVPLQFFHPYSPFAQRFLLEWGPRQALFSCRHVRMQGRKNFGLPSTGFDNGHNTFGKTICHL